MSEAPNLVKPADGHFVVRAGGAVIADTTRALEHVIEGEEPILYFPQEDIGMILLERSVGFSEDGRVFYGIAAKSGLIGDAAWAYENPPAELAAVRGYLAFVPEKATVEEV